MPTIQDSDSVFTLPDGRFPGLRQEPSQSLLTPVVSSLVFDVCSKTPGHVRVSRLDKVGSTPTYNRVLSGTIAEAEAWIPMIQDAISQAREAEVKSRAEKWWELARQITELRAEQDALDINEYITGTTGPVPFDPK